jgi:hypothetical protein
MSSVDVLISVEVLEELKRENEALKKRLETYERPCEKDPPLQFNRVKDYWDWIKEQEENMR